MESKAHALSLVTGLLNLGRALMALWLVYALILIFAPQILHRTPQPRDGIVQALAAYAIGFLLDRMLGRVRRRRAILAEAPPATGQSPEAPR
ncbi:MAG: hypothetical protein KGL34_00445 [Gammaproteobacteria bacterium]|nr:hypothetical protein [Gammaproteobacteria bacterium]